MTLFFLFKLKNEAKMMTKLNNAAHGQNLFTNMARKENSSLAGFNSFSDSRISACMVLKQLYLLCMA